MLLQETIDVICEVRQGLDASSLSSDTPFEELGLSSLELTEVIMELEERLDVDLDLDTVDAAEQLKTVGDIVGALDAIVKAKG
ncbi:MAG: acyl carrier protein [Pseudomonadota bacterium]